MRARAVVVVATIRYYGDIVSVGTASGLWPCAHLSSTRALLYAAHGTVKDTEAKETDDRFKIPLAVTLLLHCAGCPL